MPDNHNFQHLPLVLRYHGPAKPLRPPFQVEATLQNKRNRSAHGSGLQRACDALTTSWSNSQATRAKAHLPSLPPGIPILLEVDPSLDLDQLRHFFDFEIVSEEEEGFVIVASKDINLTLFLSKVNDFVADIRGSATVACVHKLNDDPNQEERLRRVLSESLFQRWPTLEDNAIYLVDVGITCLGIREIQKPPTRGKRDSDADWARKEKDWATDRAEAYQAWDDIKSERETEIHRIVVNGYGGEILDIIDGMSFTSVELPDSFSIRIKVSGKGLRDFVLNFPYIFELVEPDDIELPQQAGEEGRAEYPIARLQLPSKNAPTVCVIDSGIQEEHVLLEPAIDKTSSHSFLPGITDIGDFVSPGGHGTRVAGAVLYAENIPKTGNYRLPCWVQNARVLDDVGRLPKALFPPALMRSIVQRYHKGTRKTRIFSHSINATCHCRLRHMSAWAAEVDALCHQYDILVIQSIGNLPIDATPPRAGIRDHIEAGRDYPAYLTERSCRVADPAQSFQAVTVGSVAYQFYQGVDWQSFAQEEGHPSGFSRSGLGIWGIIKPEVVEFGGDFLRTQNAPPDIATPSEGRDCYPELARSTMHSPGPPYDRDEVGTSFAAPKVTHIAARLQQLLPDEPTLLYRALIVQSARWPEWTQDGNHNSFSILRCIGYGVPDVERATTNTGYRTTFISSGEAEITARECHIYQIPIPQSLRRQANEFSILIEVTLSYVAQPRRTRRNLRRYLSTWVDWKSSKLGESIDSFRQRALKDQEHTSNVGGRPIPWTLDTRQDLGVIEGVRRTAGTVQKDWATVKSNDLPESFCVAVVGHQGWSHDPDSAARYALTVGFEIVGKEIPIYNDLRVAVEELQAEIELESEVDEAELEMNS
jgi:hypothetical protein